MSDVSNSDLMNVLLTVKQDIGGLKADIVSHAVQFKQHCAENDELAKDVKRLELGAASASGKRGAYALMGGFAGSLLALAADYFRK